MARKIRNNVLMIVFLVGGFLAVRELLTPAYGAYGTPVSSVQQGSGTATVGYTVGLETVEVDITDVTATKSTVQAWIVFESTVANSRFDIAPVLTDSGATLTLYISSNNGTDGDFKYTWQVISYY